MASIGEPSPKQIDTTAQKAPDLAHLPNPPQPTLSDAPRESDMPSQEELRELKKELASVKPALLLQAVTKAHNFLWEYKDYSKKAWGGTGHTMFEPALYIGTFMYRLIFPAIVEDNLVSKRIDILEKYAEKHGWDFEKLLTELI